MAKLKVENRYGQIPNRILYSPSLSAKAKWLWVYIQAKPDNWEFSAERIANEMADGIDSIKSGLQEIERAGYLRRSKSNDEKWLFIITYTLYEYPTADEPSVEKPPVVKPSVEKPPIIKERSTKQEVQRKIISSSLEEETAVAVLPQEIEEKKEYWNPNINATLEFLKKTVGVRDFKEPTARQRQFANHIIKWVEKNGKEEFKNALESVLSDDFKAKNCNSICYLYREIKSVIIAPMIDTKPVYKPLKV